MRRARALAMLGTLGVLAALGGGCGDKAASTLLVVVIKSDLSAPGQLDQIRLRVQRPGGDKQLEFPVASAGQLPVIAGLLPASGGDSDDLTLTAAAYKGEGKLVETIALARFVPGERNQIEMVLAAACMTNPCQGADQACGAGGSCVPRRRPTLPWDGTPGVKLDAAPGSDGPTPVTDAPIGVDAPDAPIGDDAGNCTCPSDDNPCTQDFCMGGTCQHQPLADRVGCPGGLCIAGACCTGCLDNMGRCRLGNNALNCGSAARECATCNDQDACTLDACIDGMCRTQPQSGSTCPTGVCVNGRCSCGGPGEPCCASGNPCNGGACSNGTCGDCGGDGQSCCSSNVCRPGLLCDSGKCGKCGDVGQPCCADGSCRSGVCAGAPRACQPCGGMGQACCPMGDACGANLACVGGSCGCGGLGQPCCGGSTCNNDMNACNGVEACTNGTCARTPAVVCTARSQCHNVGVCDPGTGRCSEPIKMNGSTCNDGNGCTTGDQCRDGACISTGATVCNDNRPCTDDTCVAPGGCVFTPVGAGKSCAPPGNVCRADTCDERGNCVAMAVSGNVSCSTTTGGAGRCVFGACCPALTPTQMCPMPF